MGRLDLPDKYRDEDVVGRVMQAAPPLEQLSPPVSREIDDEAIPPEADAAFDEAVFHRSCYLSGPMTGIEDGNAPAFNRAAADLTSRGWRVFNPADQGFGGSYNEYMAEDLKQVCLADAVIVLPGWEESKGANLEVHVARVLDIPVLAYGEELAEIPTLQAPAIFGDYEPIRVGDIAPANTVTNEVIDSHAVDVLIEELHAERGPTCPNDPTFECPIQCATGCVREAHWEEINKRLDGTALIDNAIAGLKATNPKDAIGSSKLPIHLWPETATAMGTIGLLDGMLKYGRMNWREAGVRASIYIDALRRHLAAYAEGEDVDPDSGAPHLAHIGACWAILVDASAAGKLTDDRNYNGAGYRRLVEELTPHVERLKSVHAGKSPHHYTIADAAR